MRLHLECLDWSADSPEWISVENQRFEGKRIPLDNHQYNNCFFENCNFVYSGGPFGLCECQTEGQTILSLTGSAWRVANAIGAFQEHTWKGIPPV